MRINKFLSAQGMGARREIDRAISAGLVTVNDRLAELGDQVATGDIIKYKNKIIIVESEKNPDMFYLAFYKPRGLLSTCDTDIPNSIINYIHERAHARRNSLDLKILDQRIYPIGRLDQDSEGLMILSNDGELTNELTHPSHEHEKEYLVSCLQPITDNFIKRFSSGVYIETENSRGETKLVKTLACQTTQVSTHHFQTILKQGYKRQIRKMVSELGNKVTKLVRLRIANIAIQDNLIAKYEPNIMTVLNLEPGEYQELKYSLTIYK